MPKLTVRWEGMPLSAAYCLLRVTTTPPPPPPPPPPPRARLLLLLVGGCTVGVKFSAFFYYFFSCALHTCESNEHDGCSTRIRIRIRTRTSEAMIASPDLNRAAGRPPPSPTVYNGSRAAVVSDNRFPMERQASALFLFGPMILEQEAEDDSAIVRRAAKRARMPRVVSYSSSFLIIALD
jgi:hypothetical protein